jgi:molybdopterin converting factor small subunit
MIISCRYFANAVAITKKDGEAVDVPDGTTALQFLDRMIAAYGPEFRRIVYADGTVAGRAFTRPDVYLNKKRLQWADDFPDGLGTALHDGDEVWFGLVFGGG